MNDRARNCYFWFVLVSFDSFADSAIFAYPSCRTLAKTRFQARHSISCRLKGVCQAPSRFTIPCAALDPFRAGDNSWSSAHGTWSSPPYARSFQRFGCASCFASIPIYNLFRRLDRCVTTTAIRAETSWS